MEVRQTPSSKFTIATFVVVAVVIVGYHACRAAAQSSVEGQQQQQHEPVFPLLVVSGQGGLLSRNEALGGLVGGELTLNADWVHANARASVGIIGNSSDQALFTEFSGYAHLLAIGISDVTYRHYVDGHELRLLGGFSYTNSVEDVVRVDVNLGPAYFNSNRNGEAVEQFGLQVGSRVTVRFWQLTNTFFLNAFQTLSLGDGGIDLSNTTIVCDNFEEVLSGADLVCTFPEPTTEPTGSGLIDWLHTGVILHNRTFVWVYEEQDVQMGPELEVRFEHMPLRGPHFWALLSFRAQWQTQ